MKKNKTPMGARKRKCGPRGALLGGLGVITLGVAALSVVVSYRVLEPRFGSWAVPSVVALDTLWVVFQGTAILAGNHRRRVRRVETAGLALTLVNAAIPTVHLAMTGANGFDLAFVVAPSAILGTKYAWWVALPSLGRRVSAGTREQLDNKRQEVYDHLELMEAEAAHRIELLELATTLETQVAEAEALYRKEKLKIQQKVVQVLHKQAVATEETVTDMDLPASVSAIKLPELGAWTPTALALPGTETGTVDTDGTQVRALRKAVGTLSGTSGGTPSGDPAHEKGRTVTLAELAAVANVPVPEPDEQLTDAQLDVVLRHLRYRKNPPASYRKARDAFREAGFIGSEERIRTAWTALMAKEQSASQSDAAQTTEDSEEDSEGADA